MAFGEISASAVCERLYTVVTAAVPLLVVYGIVAANTAPLWVALAAAVLGTGTAAVRVHQQRRDGTLPD